MVVCIFLLSSIVVFYVQFFCILKMQFLFLSFIIKYSTLKESIISNIKIHAENRIYLAAILILAVLLGFAAIYFAKLFLCYLKWISLSKHVWNTLLCAEKNVTLHILLVSSLINWIMYYFSPAEQFKYIRLIDLLYYYWLHIIFFPQIHSVGFLTASYEVSQS